MKNARLQENQKQFSKESGFTLTEVLASTILFLLVAAVTSQLLAHPRQKMESIKQEMAVVDYLDNEFQLLHDGIGALPIEQYIKCSPCNGSAACSDICASTDADGYANTSYCGGLSDCAAPGSTVSCIDTFNLQPIIDNQQICYVRVLFDPTIDDSDTAVTDKTKATQMAALAKIYRPDGGIDENALTAFFFRR